MRYVPAADSVPRMLVPHSSSVDRPDGPADHFRRPSASASLVAEDGAGAVRPIVDGADHFLRPCRPGSTLCPRVLVGCDRRPPTGRRLTALPAITANSYRRRAGVVDPLEHQHAAAAFGGG